MEIKSTHICLASVAIFIVAVVFLALKPKDAKGNVDSKKRGTYVTVGVILLFLAIALGMFGCHEFYRDTNIASLLASSF